MPKNLTDVSAFETVAVPVGTDAATASSVETPLQTLADRTRFINNWIDGLHRGSWQDAEASPVTGASWAGTPVPRSMCYDAWNRAFHGINSNGFVVVSCDRGKSGEPAGGLGTAYRDETGTLPSGSWAGGGLYVDIDADEDGGRVAVSDSAAGQIMEATSVDGNWAARTPATGSVSWGQVEYDPDSGLWIIGGDSGEIETSPTAVTWTARTSGLTGLITAMRSNRQASGTILAADATHVSRSTDGTTWAATAHSMGSAPFALAYDSRLSRWVAVTATEVYASDDDGITWSRVGTPNSTIIDAQDETSYDGSPATEGSFAGGTGHAAADVITLNDGSTITVDAVSAGVVTQFTVSSSTSRGANEGIQLQQVSSTGSGYSFTLTPEIDNVVMIDTLTVDAVDIDGDERGGIILVIDTAPGAAGVRRMYTSRDGGDTWTRIDHPGSRVYHGAIGTVAGPWSAGVRYGGGRWACLGETSTPTAVAIFSPVAS